MKPAQSFSIILITTLVFGIGQTATLASSFLITDPAEAKEALIKYCERLEAELKFYNLDEPQELPANFTDQTGTQTSKDPCIQLQRAPSGKKSKIKADTPAELNTPIRQPDGTISGASDPMGNCTTPTKLKKFTLHCELRNTEQRGNNHFVDSKTTFTIKSSDFGGDECFPSYRLQTDEKTKWVITRRNGNALKYPLNHMGHVVELTGVPGRETLGATLIFQRNYGSFPQTNVETSNTFQNKSGRSDEVDLRFMENLDEYHFIRYSLQLNCQKAK